MDFPNAQLPKLEPLNRSFTVDDVEDDLRNLFIDLFESMMAQSAFDVNVLGVGHLGSLNLIRKLVNVDGLALIDGPRDEAATRYLYKAWKSRNKNGRGFHFLRTYLQLLFPNSHNVELMAQDKSGTYPNQLSPLSRSDSSKFATSRVRVSVDSSKTTWENVDKMAPILRSIIPARILLYFSLLTSWNQGNYIGATMVSGSVGVVYPAAKSPTELVESVFTGAALFGVSINTVYPAAYLPTEWVDNIFVGSAWSGISINTIYPKI